MQPIVENDLTIDFKLAMRRLTTTICLVTTRFQDRLYGMAATAVQSVCMEPPSLLVCLNKSASISYPLSQHGRFAINLLRTEHADLVPVFSGKVKSEDRFKYGSWDEVEDMPVLRDAQAAMICNRIAVMPIASHDILVGEVRAVRVFSEISPLLYQDGALVRASPLA